MSFVTKYCKGSGVSEVLSVTRACINYGQGTGHDINFEQRISVVNFELERSDWTPLPKIHLKGLTNQIYFASHLAFTKTLFIDTREIGNCTLMPPQQERLRLTAYSKVSSNALGIYKWLMAEKLCRQYPIDFPG